MQKNTYQAEECAKHGSLGWFAHLAARMCECEMHTGEWACVRISMNVWTCEGGMAGTAYNTYIGNRPPQAVHAGLVRKARRCRALLTHALLPSSLPIPPKWVEGARWDKPQPVEASLTSHGRAISDLCQYELWVPSGRRRRIQGSEPSRPTLKQQPWLEFSLLEILLQWKRARGSCQPLWLSPTSSRKDCSDLECLRRQALPSPGTIWVTALHGTCPGCCG